MGLSRRVINQDTALRMLELLSLDAQMQSLDQPLFGALQISESLAAHNPPRSRIRNAENHLPASLV